jgi:hypothetical protein
MREDQMRGITIVALPSCFNFRYFEMERFFDDWFWREIS